ERVCGHGDRGRGGVGWTACPPRGELNVVERSQGGGIRGPRAKTRDGQGPRRAGRAVAEVTCAGDEGLRLRWTIDQRPIRLHIGPQRVDVERNVPGGRGAERARQKRGSSSDIFSGQGYRIR